MTIKLVNAFREQRDPGDAVVATSRAIKVPVRQIRKILNELRKNGNLSTNFNPFKNRKRVFDKLRPLQKDQIRHKVHDLFKAVIEKDPGAEYPTVAAIHCKVAAIQNMPKFGLSTMRNLLKIMGFK